VCCFITSDRGGRPAAYREVPRVILSDRSTDTFDGGSYGPLWLYCPTETLIISVRELPIPIGFSGARQPKCITSSVGQYTFGRIRQSGCIESYTPGRNLLTPCRHKTGVSRAEIADLVSWHGTESRPGVYRSRILRPTVSVPCCGRTVIENLDLVQRERPGLEVAVGGHVSGRLEDGSDDGLLLGADAHRRRD